MGRFAWSFFNFTNLENYKRQWKKKRNMSIIYYNSYVCGFELEVAF